MKAYNHTEIEKKWQKKWADAHLYETPDAVEGKENFYALVELPYTSGDLHVGHWYAYSVPDMFVRMKRMQGYNVLYPIGFDTFGLPAENAAIRNNADPAKWTEENTNRMREQLHYIGGAFDWSRDFMTCEPTYYKWTQWLFLKFYEKGLAYRGKAFVNWDPVDKTVLANEQVLPDGTAERSGAKVEKKELKQWFFKITEYADRLIDDLEPLSWPQPIKEAQKNWIGRKEGINIDYAVEGGETITCFTTRPDTNFGATFIVLAPEHSFVQKILTGDLETEEKKKVAAYVSTALRKSELERQEEGRKKTGVFTGFYATNNLNGNKLPVWISDFVLGGFGTGAVVGVPGHDTRDFEFATAFDIPVLRVVVGPDGDTSEITQISQVQEEAGRMVNSEFLDGLPIQEAIEVMKDFLEKKGFGKRVKTYRLRDWLISRQRYWGAPIPIVYDPEGNAHTVPEEHLPWLLPTDVDFTPTGEAPLARSNELKERTEKIFGKGWTPETDTMDGFVDNSWYFFRYLDPRNKKEFCSIQKQKQWMPIVRYSGGAEHTTVHVLYSRFFAKALFDFGLATEKEPYKVRMNRGIILAEDGRKMSKRWGNVINPDEQVANVGADAVRTYLAFIGPYNEVGSFPWNTNGLIGVRRFLERVVALSEKIGDVPLSKELSIVLNQTIKKVGEDIESMKFNTSVSQLMIFSNELQKLDSVPREAYETLLKLIAPFAPHLAEELWENLGHNTSIHLEKWPAFEASKLETDMVVVAVQIGGKTRGAVSVPRGTTQEVLLSELAKDQKMAKIVPQKPTRVVFVPDKIINVIP